MSDTTMNAAASAPTPGDAAPEPRSAGYLRSSLGNPTALIAYAAPLGVVAIIGILVLVSVLGGDAAYVTNGRLTPVRVTVPVVVTVAVVVVVSLVVEVFAFAAATVAVAATLRGERPGLVAVWQRAFPRLPAVLAIRFLDGVVVTLLAVGLAAAILFWGFGAILVGIVELPILLVLLPLAIAPSIAAVTDAGPVGSIRLAWRTIGRQGWPERIPRSALFFTLLLGAGVLIGVAALLRLVPPGILAYGVVDTVQSVVSVVVGILVIAALTRWALYAPTEFAAAPAGARLRPALSLLGAVASTAVPTILVAGLLAVNTGGWTIVDAATRPTWFPSGAVTALGDDRTAGMVAQDIPEPYLSVCGAADCDILRRMYAPGPIVMDGLPDGDLLIADWSYTPPDTTSTTKLQVTRVTPKDLAKQSTPGIRDNVADFDVAKTAAGLHTLDRITYPVADDDVLGFFGKHQLAVDAAPGGTVIASVVSNSDDQSGRDESATFGLYRCAVADCSTTATTASTTLPAWVPVVGQRLTGVDVAVAKNGTAFASVVSGLPTDPLRLMVVAPDGTVQTRVLASSGPNAEYDLEDYGDPGSGDQGAQVAVDGQGRATVLFEQAGSSAFTLYHCDDASCSHWSTHRIDANDGRFVQPTLAIDATDRPMFAGIDPAAGTTVLRSCDDATCSSWHSRVLGSSRGLDLFALDLDPRQRPVVMATSRSGYTTNAERRIVHCEQLRCGAP